MAPPRSPRSIGEGLPPGERGVPYSKQGATTKLHLSVGAAVDSSRRRLSGADAVCWFRSHAALIFAAVRNQGLHRALSRHAWREPTVINLGARGVYRVRLVEKQTCGRSCLPAMSNHDERSSEHRTHCG